MLFFGVAALIYLIVLFYPPFKLKVTISFVYRFFSKESLKFGLYLHLISIWIWILNLLPFLSILSTEYSWFLSTSIQNCLIIILSVWNSLAFVSGLPLLGKNCICRQSTFRDDNFAFWFCCLFSFLLWPSFFCLHLFWHRDVLIRFFLSLKFAPFHLQFRMFYPFLTPFPLRNLFLSRLRS